MNELDKVLDLITLLRDPGDLRRVAAAALEQAELIESWRQPAPTADEVKATPGGCYRLEMVKCGKERCKRCADGRLHGPYWYSYRYSGGRVKKVYIGKKRPDEAGAGRADGAGDEGWAQQ